MRTSDITKLTTFHDTLNQELWDGTELRKDVQLQLLKIAKEFVKFIKVPGLKLEDVTISGSNVSYNYNDQSDIDLHLIVDGEGPCWEHLNELFLAKKNLFNDEHDIKLKGHEVELYVQDKNQPHISNGIYSIVRDAWIKKPQQITADPDKSNIQHKYNHLKHIIDDAIDSGSISRMTRVQEKIKNYRQSGLNKHGEFGAENLAFKMLRNEGLLQRLFDAKLAAMDDNLSLTENFADGRGPGRPGDSQRHGIPKGATIAQLEKAAKAKGRKGQLARWQLNMRRGHKKEESVVAEKWSQKYKRSIDCSHPKGFSQKAHCAGRKKTNESITGDDMLKVFHQTHHAAGENPEMEQFIRDHAWGIKMIPHSQLPDIDDEVYFDDPFDRVMDIDTDHVRDVIKHASRGGKTDPIIMGPGNSIIDGNHRAQAAKRMGIDIQAYVPMEKIEESEDTSSKLITEPFKDPVAVLRKNLDKMKAPNGDKIDLLMLKIANRQGIGADLLHKMWVDKYKRTPDVYCGLKKVDTKD